MIVTEFYKGQGLGNQLWVYAVARILAEKKGLSFSIIGRECFKGGDFIKIDFGQELVGGSSPEGGPPYKLPFGIKNYYRERKEVLGSTTLDISRTDPGLLEIPAETKFDGVCQSTLYLEGYENKIKEWIKIECPSEKDLDIGPDTCILHIRCGDFMKTEAFMDTDYYKKAMAYVKKNNPNVSFYCVTDQKDVVKKMLPEIPIIGSTDGKDERKASHHFGGPISRDFCLLLKAPYLIIPPSSFSWWAAFLNENKKIVVAPKYWARHNSSDGFWSTYDIVTKSFSYMDKSGEIYTAEECNKEKEAFEKTHLAMFNSNIPENTLLKSKSRFILSIVFLIKNLLKKMGLLQRIKRLWYWCWSKTQKPVTSTKHQLDIKEHRKRLRVFDCFLFFNELELLEIRLNVLDPHVDYFVIVESTQKFSGGKKPLFYQENKERFKKWEHKIIHYVVNDTPDSEQESVCDQEILALARKSSNVPKGQIHWLREFYQKEMIKKPLMNIAKDDDVCFVSDVDEIWNPEKIIDFRPDVIYKMRQKVYSYFLNNLSNEAWAGTYVTKYKNLKNNSINHLDTPSKTKYTYIKDGGWHFTNIGGADRLIEKIESYGHQEFNNETIKSKIALNIEMNRDFIGRNFKLRIDESNLPKYILDNRDKYRSLFK